MLLTPGDPRYPALLGVIASPPSVHVRGAIVAADGLAIAIVGSRRASTYGLEVAERLAFDLAARGVTIVSGLARGIDAAAHRGALAADGRTPSFATGLYLLGTGQMSCKNCRICGVPRFVVLDTLETKARGRASRVRRAGSWRCYDQTSPSI